MKKIVSSILLLSLFLATVGYHFIFQVKQQNIKEDMEEYLSKENIRNAVELRFSLNELSKLKWENDKEFVYNGELYDVVKKKNVNGSLVIQCIKDKKETHLVND